MFSQVSVCHTVGGGSLYHHYPWCLAHHYSPPPQPRYKTWDPPATDIWWPTLETYSNLLTWGLRKRHLVLATETGSTYGLQAAVTFIFVNILCRGKAEPNFLSGIGFFVKNTPFIAHDIFLLSQWCYICPFQCSCLHIGLPDWSSRIFCILRILSVKFIKHN